MIDIELHSLVKKLSPELKDALEAAVAECVKRGHLSVELEHWFLTLLQHSSSWDKAIAKVSMAKEFMLGQLDDVMAGFPRGKEVTPSLSFQLVELIKDSWMFTSLNEHQLMINEYHLLQVVKQRCTRGDYNGVLHPWVSQLSSEWLRMQAKAVSTSADIVSEKGFSAETPALDKYSHNLTAAARNGELDPVFGRSDEIRMAIDILCRRRQNSPILVGDPGVGKTAIVEGLAHQIVTGNVPPILANVELRSLDLTLLQAGASIKGEFENRLKDLINEIKHSPVPIIIFIDEAHTLIGAGGAAGQNDAANILKPALARGEFRSIAATTWAEYKQYFESDAALTRRFQLISVPEPSAADSIQILRTLKKNLEKHHQVSIRQSAIEAAVTLSIRYLPERKLPDKAISLLDTACSRIRLSQNSKPRQLELLSEQILSTRDEIAILSHEAALWGGDELAVREAEQNLIELERCHAELSDRWSKECVLAKEIMALQQQLDDQLLSGNIDSQAKVELDKKRETLATLQGEQPLVMVQVNKQTIADVVSLWTGIPIGNMLKQDVDQLLNLERDIGERVIGQTTPIAEIAQAIRISRAALTDPRKPIGVFLMCGPSGVGKTETALALTDHLYGGEKNITTINMSEFKEEHKVSMLVGAPAGYVGYGKGGVLTEAVRKNPYTVLLLDEMEKAHPGVHDIFYQIFDKGKISDSEGRQIDFRNTIIIMTSNAADREIVDACRPVRPEIPVLVEQIQPVLQRFFKPAFLGRATIVPYYPLSDEEMAQIAGILLRRVAKQVHEHYKAEFHYQPDVIDLLVNMNQSPESGARSIEQLVNRYVISELANQCIIRISQALDITRVSISVVEEKIQISIE